MVSLHTQDIVDRAKAIYATQLKFKLESEHQNAFVAIEPESGDYFIADSFGEAVSASRTAHPNRISFVIRIGHPAAIHIGVMTS